MRRGKSLREDWWRHLVGIVASVFALFPVVYIVSAAFNDNDALSGAAVIPQSVTLHNFGQILHNP
ncbi:MAG: arabinogalactan oligomer / maltooligosaccharide transport system permease protein, partial [Gaiellaceae bacterium]|nr:arabinogalactan oligomer / maltooligosaccharide transport system permease protein [Gaiellaceae bacterium]